MTGPSRLQPMAIVMEDQDGPFLEVVDTSEFDADGLLPLGTELCRLADAEVLRDQVIALAAENQELRKRLQLRPGRVRSFAQERQNTTGVISRWLRAYGSKTP